MDHWFDTFTRTLARPITRRDLLKRLGTSVAFMGAFRWSAASGADTQRCASEFSNNGLETRFAATASVDGSDLYLFRSTVVSGTTIADEWEIQDQQRRPFFKARAVPLSGGEVQIAFEFARPIVGISTLALVTGDNGRTLSGALDGRPFASFATTEFQRPLRFRDGLPMPHVEGPPGLGPALADLVRRSVEGRSSCAATLRAGSEERGGSFRLASHEMGEATNPKRRNECKICIASCYTVAVMGGIAACIVIPFVGCAIGAVIYAVVADVACLGYCNSTGAPCCPKACGGGCCTPSGTCLDPSRGVCCGPTETPCRGRTCCDAGLNCAPDGSCCAAGLNVCKDGCCEAECALDGNCCKPPGYYYCEGKCCSSFNKCCKGQCCPRATDQCHYALGCCPVICGPNCCGEGQVCRDAANGVCGPCPAGQHPCADEGRCCPDGMRCCPGGVCCVGDYCEQNSTTGAWECRHLR